MTGRILGVILGFAFLKGVSAQSDVDHWESVVLAGETWRYYVNSTTYPPADWYMPGFDDSSWSEGQGGFGNEDGDDKTILPAYPYVKSVHVRKRFNITDTANISMALLSMDFDDGFVAWINGVEIARSNLGAPLQNPSQSIPQTDHEAVLYQGGVPPSYPVFKKTLNKCLVNGVNVLAVQVNNYGTSSSDFSCIPFLSVALKSPGKIYRPVPAWFRAPDEVSNLPLAIVITNGNNIVPEDKVMVDFGIIDNGESGNRLFDEWNGYRGKAGIEYRGSSSLGFPKKNFALEIRNNAGHDSAVSLLGMPPEADWVLHGPYSDKSLVRNRLAYDLARKMGNYAPRARFCELYIDYEYRGVYVLIERIKRDSNRVNIAKLDTTDVEGNDLTGGYIIKIDRSADGSYTDGWFSKYRGSGTSGGGPFFAWHYPKWEDILPVQMNYIRNKVTRFEDALFGADFQDPYEGYRSHINVTSFIDYFILVELSRNVDGYRLSTFLYKNRDDRDPRIHMGPVWDYDLAFGNADYFEASNLYGWNYPVVADGWGTPYWWSRLLSDNYFINNLKCRWNQLREDVLSDVSLMAMVDAYVDTLGEAVERNFNRWPVHGTYIWPNAFVGKSFAEDINFMKKWILDRAAWMDKNMPGVCTTTPVDDYKESSLIINVVPNPSVDALNLEIQNPRHLSVFLEIINTSGIVVYSEKIDGDENYSRRIPLSRGIYILRTKCGSEIQTLKAVVQ